MEQTHENRFPPGLSKVSGDKTGRTKKMSNKMFRTKLERENADLDEKAKLMLIDLANERFKLKQVLKVLVKHARSTRCQANSEAKKELFRLQALSRDNGCGDMDLHPARPQQNFPQAAQTPLEGSPTDNALEESANFSSADLNLDIPNIEMAENFGDKQWLVFNNNNNNAERMEGDISYVSPPPENVWSDSGRTKISQQREDLQGLRVQVKHRYPQYPRIQTYNETALSKKAHQVHVQSSDAVIDQRCESDTINLASTAAMDSNIHLSLGNNQQPHSPLSSWFGLDLKRAVQDDSSVSCVGKQKEVSLELESSEKTTGVSEKDSTFGQLVSCWDWEGFALTKDVLAKTADNIDPFESAEDDMSDIFDVNEEKLNMLLKEEMHQLYVREELSTEPHVHTVVIPSCGTANESHHDRFLQFADADLESYSGNLPSTVSSLQLDGIDFYTEDFMFSSETITLS